MALNVVRPSRKRVEPLAAVDAWATLPTATLVTASLIIQPVYIVRHVTASAPGLAILLSLMLGRAARLAAKGSTWRELVITAAGLAARALS